MSKMTWRDAEQIYITRRLLKGDLVVAAVEKLPEPQRVVFMLRELEGNKPKEISKITGMKLGTVKSRLHRARSNFAHLTHDALDYLAPRTKQA